VREAVRGSVICAAQVAGVKMLRPSGLARFASFKTARSRLSSQRAPHVNGKRLVTPS